MKIETYDWRTNDGIAQHYLYEYDRIGDLYEYDPLAINVEEERRQWLTSAHHLRADRAKLAEVLIQYNTQAGNDEMALQAAASLGQDGTLAVVGGQQAGLLGGPCLVIYKAVTIIQLARKASKRLGCQVVPVFWIAGEDHDVAEVNHTYVMSPQQEPRKIALDIEATGRVQVSSLPIHIEQWRQSLEQLDDVLLETEFKVNLMGKLFEIAERSETLSDFMAQLLAWLFGRHGLVLLDAADPALRQLEGPMFEQLIDSSEAINEALHQSKMTLNTRGYKAQAEVRTQQANLFVIHEGERTLLFHHEQGFVDRQATVAYSKAELLHLADSSPELLSTNVFTRPLMQEFLLPTLYTVLGPGEIAYWSLLKGAFQVIGMKMPIIAPRCSYTVLESTVAKHMARYDLTFHDVVHSLSAKRDQWLSEQDQMGLMQQFAETKDRFVTLYDPLLAQISEIHEGMRQLGETNKQKILQQIDFLQSRTYQALESQHDTALRHFERISNSIMPLGKPQERVYNIFAYVNKYGFELIDQLVSHEITDRRQHHIVYV